MNIDIKEKVRRMIILDKDIEDKIIDTVATIPGSNKSMVIRKILRDYYERAERLSS